MAGYADVEDPVALLKREPDTSGGPTVEEAIKEAGFEVQAVNWVWEKVVGEDLVSSIIEPITGDFEQIAKQAGQWGNVKDALQAIRNNLNAGLDELQPAWEGEAADKFRDKIGTTWTLGLEADAQAAGLIGLALKKVAEGSKRACDQCLSLIKSLVDKLIEAAAMLPIPVVGWGRAVKLVYDGIQIYNAIMQLIEGIKSIIEGAQQVIQGVQQVGTALSKIDDIHNLNDAINVANETGEGVSNIKQGAGDIKDGATQAASATGDLASSTHSAHDNARGLHDERSSARDGSSDSGGTSPSGNHNSNDGTGSTNRTRQQQNGNIDSSVDDPHAAAQSADRPYCKDDPIDVTTGEVVLSQTDVALPGLLPLVFARHLQSNYRAGTLFGSAWASTLDQRVEVGPAHVWLATEDGRLLRFPKPAGAEPVLPEFGPALALRRTGDGYAVTSSGSGLTWEFDAVEPDWAAGSVLPLSTVRRRGGGELHIDYAGRLPTRVRHSGGYEVAVETANDRVTALRLTSAAAPITLMSYDYDEDGQLAKVINSSNAALTFTYRDGRLSSWTDRNDVWYSYRYDERGRAVATVGTDGMLNGTFDYSAGRTVHTDTLGNATTYELNDLGQVVRQIDPLGAVITREWDIRDRPRAITNALGHVTHYGYDDAGNVTTVTRPDGTTVTATPNEFGLPLVTTDPDGGTWVRAYDAHGNLVAETDPAGATTRFAFDERGHLRQTIDALGNATTYETNAAGLVVRVTDPKGATTEYRRDELGRVGVEVGPLGETSRYNWTIEGKLLAHTRPDGTTQRWRYDGEGNQIEHVDALGRSTRTEFTTFDLPAARITPDGGRTAYTYDTEMRLVEAVGPHGASWRYTYDAAGRVIRESDFAGRVLNYTYDAVGRLATRTNGAGETVEFVRDVHGDVLAKRTPTGTANFERDRCGHVVRATNAHADVQFERDSRGRVLAETINGRTISFSYDAAGRRVGRRTPLGVESTWAYDEAGRPVALNTAGHDLGFEHDLLGRQVRRSVGEVELTQSWTPTNQLTSQVVTAKQAVTHRTWRYGADGYLVGTSDPTGTRQLHLDELSRVVSVAGQNWSERYDYDAVGNIVQAVVSGDDGAAAGSREYSGTVLRSAGRTSYGYDRQGRVIWRRRRTLSGQVRQWGYTWDADDRLTMVITPDGVTWRYHYDPIGRRIAKQRLAGDGTVAEHVTFSWDGARLVEHQYSSGASATWEYGPGSATPLAQVDRDEVNERFYAIVADLVGSPTELLDPTGTVAWRRTTTLWGQTVAQSGNANCPLRFPGQYHDEESGWHYNYFRYYDPETGRYASPDPLGLRPAINPGTYVPNPTRQIDPLGLQGCTTTGDDAKQQALRDAGVPPGSQPLDSYQVPATTPRGKQIMDENHQPVMFPEEVYENDKGDLVVFQDHYTGHQYGEGGVGDQDPHAHVRPYDDTRNGQVPGAQEHYYYNPSLGRPTPAE